MKRWLASLVLVTAAAALSGCYYDPGYSYVRSSGYSGDVYYGRSAPVYDGGYYGAPGYYGYYGNGYYGCCYAPGVSVGVGSVWYGGSRYRHDRRGGYRGNSRGDYNRGQGHRSADRSGDTRRGNRRGHDDHDHQH
jgi:hypothetical protein